MSYAFNTKKGRTHGHTKAAEITVGNLAGSLHVLCGLSSSRRLHRPGSAKAYKARMKEHYSRHGRKRHHPVQEVKDDMQAIQKKHNQNAMVTHHRSWMDSLKAGIKKATSLIKKPW